jgi:hypothetical protein
MPLAPVLPLRDLASTEARAAAYARMPSIEDAGVAALAHASDRRPRGAFLRRAEIQWYLPL